MIKKSLPSAAARGLAVAASLALLLASGPLLRAQNYTETGDAGSTPGTAQATGLIQTSNGNPPQNIFGTISGLNDADVYRIQVTAPMLFSATTVNTTTGLTLDTQLFLFDASARPVYANDDSSGTSFASTLPPGSTFLANLSPGLYYLAISLSGNDPVNTANQLVFNPGTTSTELRGPASGLNPDSFSGFNNGNTFAQSGAYQIIIVPEPSTWALAAVGVLALGLVAVRRRRAMA